MRKHSNDDEYAAPITGVTMQGIVRNDQLLFKSAWLVYPQTKKRDVLYVTSIVLLGLLFV